jgi:hypothetical protein
LKCWTMPWEMSLPYLRGSRKASLQSLVYIPPLCVSETLIPRSTPISSPTFGRYRFRSTLRRGGTAVSSTTVDRQDFSLQNASPLPINDSKAFLAVMKVLTASNPGVGLWSLSLKDKLRALRAITLAQVQSHQTIKAYQQLRYWRNVPFCHGPIDVVEYSATPSQTNSANPLQKSNPKALQDELIRHLTER